MEYNIKELLNSIDFEKNKLHKTKYNLYLTTYEIEILNKYHITYEDCKTEKELIQKLEYILPRMTIEEQEELEQISMSISERDYYQNTNK